MNTHITTQRNLVRSLQKRCRITKTDAVLVSGALFDLMSSAILRGNTLKITGFGTFKTKTYKGRRFHNVQTKTVSIVPDFKVVSFSPSKNIKNKVKGK